MAAAREGRALSLEHLNEIAYLSNEASDSQQL